MSEVVRILEGKKEAEPAPTLYESSLTYVLESHTVSPFTNSSTTPTSIERENLLVRSSSSESSFSSSIFVCKCCGEVLCTNSTNIPAHAIVKQRPVSSYFRIKDTHRSNYTANWVSLPDVTTISHQASSLFRLEGSTNVVKEIEEGIDAVENKLSLINGLNSDNKIIGLSKTGEEENLGPNDPGKSSILVLAYEVAAETSTATSRLDQNTQMDTIAPVDSGHLPKERESETGRLDLNKLTDRSSHDIRIIEKFFEGKARILSISENPKEPVIQALVEVEVDSLGGVMVEDPSSQIVGSTNLQQPSLVYASESQNAVEMGVMEVPTSFTFAILQENFAQICSSTQETWNRVVFERPPRNLNQTNDLTLPARHFVEGLCQALLAIEPDDVSAMVIVSRNIFSSLDVMKVDYNSLIDEVETFINACQNMRLSDGASQISTLKNHVNQLLQVKRQTIEEFVRSMPLLKERGLKVEDKVTALRARIEELENELVEARVHLECLSEAAKMSLEEYHTKMAMLESLKQEETTLITLLQQVQDEERRINESCQAAENTFLLCRDRMKATSL